MNTIRSGDGTSRRRLTAQVKRVLRELNIELSLLNHQVSASIDLADRDFACFDLISRHGPLSPSDLSRRADLHPATVTGILDRLERDGWVARERDPDDRRAILIRALPRGNAEVLRQLTGMNASMDEICSDYTEDELGLLADFLRRTIHASRAAADELADD